MLKYLFFYSFMMAIISFLFYGIIREESNHEISNFLVKK